MNVICAHGLITTRLLKFKIKSLLQTSYYMSLHSFGFFKTFIIHCRPTSMLKANFCILRCVRVIYVRIIQNTTLLATALIKKYFFSGFFRSWQRYRKFDGCRRKMSVKIIQLRYIGEMSSRYIVLVIMRFYGLNMGNFSCLERVGLFC